MIGIIGATGTMGGALARLLADDDMPFRALVRGGTTTVPGAEVVLADLDEPATLTGALAGIDQLFLLTAGTGPQVVQQEAVIDAAVAAGIDHVVKVSTVGAHPRRRDELRRVVLAGGSR